VRIAIIGAGNVGSALSRACIAVGHSVVLSARHTEHAGKVAAEVGASAASSSVEAIGGADVIVLAVPSRALAALSDEIRPHAAGMTVVDPTNPMDIDPAEMLAATGSVAEGTQLLLPESSVVKAFNTILAGRLNDPVVDGVPLDGFYAGDDEAAKSVVAELIAALGFRPLDVGALPVARALELMAFINIGLNMRNGWSWQTGWKLLGPAG
jgi:NADPH-dependent F420 reductase